MNKIQKWKLMGLMTFMSLTASAQEMPKADNNAQQYKTENVAKSGPKRDFSAKLLATAMARSGVDRETSLEIYTNYLNRADNDGMISVKDFVESFTDVGISKEKFLEIWDNIEKIEEASMPKGYNLGNYTLSYSLSPSGTANNIRLSGGARDAEAIKEITHARCRHLGLAVDEMGVDMKSSEFMLEHLVYDSIKKKQANGEEVEFGDKFIENFEKRIEKDGLFIGKDQRLHGVEESLDKPLKTKADLYKEYQQREAARMKAFSNR